MYIYIYIYTHHTFQHTDHALKRGPRQGQGGGKPPPGRKEGQEVHRFERRKYRRIKRTEGDLHADPVGRRVLLKF